MKSLLQKSLEMKPADDSQSFDVKNFQEIVLTRRSVRVFEPTPIPPQVVQDCLDMALLAPNSSNLQAWEFYWVRTPEKKAKLVEACLSQPAARTAAELIVSVARTKSWRKMRQAMLEHFAKLGDKAPASAIDYYKRLIPLAYNQGPLGLGGVLKKIAVTGRGLFKPTPREPVSKSDMKVWAHKSCSLACENLMLAFRAYGYDTCPMEGMDSARVHQLLELPADASIVMVIAAGKRSPKGIYGPRLRFQRDWFIKEV